MNMEKKYKDIEKVLISKDEIKKRVKELGEEISNDLKGEEVIVVGVLKGCVVFLSDIIRELDMKLDLDFMICSSYENATESSGNVKIIKDINVDVKGKVVLIIEDIIDSGRTMANLKEIFKVRQCKDFKICTLLDKKERRATDIEADYIGFDIPNEFVVGYGLDYAGKYRNLPEIGVLKPEVYKNNF